MYIRILPKTVSDYISAGEIIHHPASVVKELMENSIDADSTRIHINIEKGGMHSISINDNGNGIRKKDLILSLTRYATSKIYSIQDLAFITTLGFRGEALASIRSVSRLKLFSRHYLEKIGWSIISHGKNIDQLLHPIAHPKGTTLIVSDLFFNKPIRKKCFQSEYYEFMKIDEVVRRLSLSKNQVSVSLKHNKKLIRYYRASHNDIEKKNRINVICGFSFIEKSVLINNFYKNMKIFGWVYVHTKENSKKFIQYCYINKRIVFNKTINHAIFQAVKEIYTNIYKISYILYFTISSNELDINIHPKKNEINIFHKRIVHGFIYQSILFSIKTISVSSNFSGTSEWILKNKSSSGSNAFLKKRDKKSILEKTNLSNFKSNLKSIVYKNFGDSDIFDKFFSKKYPTIFGNFLVVINKCYLLTEKCGKLVVLSLPMAKRLIYKSKLECGIKNYNIPLKHFENPIYIIVNKIQHKFLSVYKKSFSRIGLNYSLSSNSVKLCSVPYILIDQDFNSIITNILNYFIHAKEVNWSELIEIISNSIEINIPHWDNLQIIVLFSEFKKYCKNFINNPLPSLLQFIDINHALSLLKI
ncbi:MAG: DNA mismatch repair endonuclease MutL [Buchnera aphidicola (Nurudea yanoniella)]